MKKTKEEVRDWLIKNATNQKGDLDLSNLDFSEFEGYVDISGMKVKNTLYQNDQTAGKNLFQSGQKVSKNLFQQGQSVEEDLFQGTSYVKGNLYQDRQIVKGKLEQSGQTVEGFITTHKPEGNDIVEVKERYILIKKPKKITEEELKKMGYILEKSE